MTKFLELARIYTIIVGDVIWGHFDVYSNILHLILGTIQKYSE